MVTMFDQTDNRTA